jgi:hypothetical protein
MTIFSTPNWTMKEFAQWQNLEDYSLVLKQDCSKLAEPRGLVPTRIAELLEMTRIFLYFSFDQLADKSYRRAAYEMEKNIIKMSSR